MKKLKFIANNNMMVVEYDGYSLKASVKGVKEVDISHPAIMSFLMGKRAKNFFKRGCAARRWENPLPKIYKENKLRELSYLVDPQGAPKYESILEVIRVAKKLGIEKVILSSVAITLSAGTIFVQGSIFMKDPKAVAFQPGNYMCLKNGSVIEPPANSSEFVFTQISPYRDKVFITTYYKRLCRSVNDLKALCDEISREWERTNQYYQEQLKKVEEELIY